MEKDPSRAPVVQGCNCCQKHRARAGKEGRRNILTPLSSYYLIFYYFYYPFTIPNYKSTGKRAQEYIVCRGRLPRSQ